MVNVGDLVVKLTADTGGFDKGISGMIEKLGGLGSIGIAGAVAAAGAAIGAFVNSSIQHVRALDDQMLQFQVNTGATADQAAVFSNQLRALYRGNTDSIEDLAAAATMVTQRFGEQGEGLADTTQAFLDYAKVTGQDTAAAVDQMADIMAKMNLEMDDGVGLMDSLVAVAQRTGTPIEELQGALAASAGQFAAMGFSGTEAVAMMGALSAAGMDVTGTVRALNTFMKGTASITDAQSEAMERLGIELNVVSVATDKTVKAAAEHGIELREGQKLTDEMRRELLQLGVSFDSVATLAGTQREALEQMFAQLAGGEPDVQMMQDMMELFGTKVGPELATAISTGALSLDEFMAIVQNSEGTVASASAVYDKQLGERWELIKRNHLEPFMNFIGQFFVAALHQILDVVEVVAAGAERGFEFIRNVFANMTKNVRGDGGELREALRNVFSAITSLVTASFTAIVALWETVLKPAFDAIAPLVKVIFSAMQSIISMNLTVITNVLNALAALLRGDFSEAWQLIKDTVSIVIETISEVAQTVFNALAEYFASVMGLIRDTFTTVWNDVKQFLSDMFAGIGVNANTVFDALAAYFNAVLTGIRNVFESVWNLIKAMLTGNWDETRDAAIAVWTAIQEYFTSVLAAVLGVFTAVWDEIKAFVKNNWDEIAAAAEFVWNQIEGYFSTVLNVIRGVFETVWNAIKDFVTGIFGDIFASASDRFTAVREAIMGAFTGIVEFVGGILGGVVEVFQNAISGITSTIDSVRGAIGAVQDTVGGLVESATGAVHSALSGAASAWENRPAFLGGRGGESDPAPDFEMPVPVGPVPGFAAGGLVRGPTLAMVGEAGPELVTPLDRLNEFMGGGEQTIIVELDGRAIMRSVAPRMVNEVRLRTGIVTQ